MTEKKILFINFFAVIFQILVYFLCKNRNPPARNWGVVKPPFSENLGARSTPLSKKGGWTLCICLLFNPLPPSLSKFSPGLFVGLQEILYPSYCKKIMHFQSKTHFFLLTYCWSVLIFLFRFVSLGTFSQFCHYETTNSFTYIHSFLFDLSSNHVA